MALLPNLCNLENNLSRYEPRTDGQIPKANAARNNVLAKGSVGDICTAPSKFLNFAEI